MRKSLPAASLSRLISSRCSRHQRLSGSKRSGGCVSGSLMQGSYHTVSGAKRGSLPRYSAREPGPRSALSEANESPRYLCVAS